MSDDLLDFEDDDLLDLGMSMEERRKYSNDYATIPDMYVFSGESANPNDYAAEVAKRPDEGPYDDMFAEYTIKEEFYYWLKKYNNNPNPMYVTLALAPVHKMRVNAAVFEVSSKYLGEVKEGWVTTATPDGTKVSVTIMYPAEPRVCIWFDLKTGRPVLPNPDVQHYRIS